MSKNRPVYTGFFFSNERSFGRIVRMMYTFKMKLEDRSWDHKLHISTMGMIDHMEDEDHFRYEPTPYCVLKRLVESGWITKNSRVVDYGCGKGRVCFFLSNQTGCQATGVDFSKEMIHFANQNNLQFSQPDKVRFVWKPAEKYPVEDEDVFFFFNPFSYDILRGVLRQILDSWYKNPRKMTLCFYYPSSAYISTLMQVPELMFLDEIDCDDLFVENDSRERILIFETEDY